MNNCVNCNSPSSLPIILCDDCKKERDDRIAQDMLSLAQVMLSMGINLRDKELTEEAKESLQYWTGEVIDGTF